MSEEADFKKSEIKKIEISVRIDNTAAFRLYQRLGFKETVTYLAYELKLQLPELTNLDWEEWDSHLLSYRKI